MLEIYRETCQNGVKNDGLAIWSPSLDGFLTILALDTALGCEQPQCLRQGAALQCWGTSRCPCLHVETEQ
jgi:hypothetical protein